MLDDDPRRNGDVPVPNDCPPTANNRCVGAGRRSRATFRPGSGSGHSGHWANCPSGLSSGHVWQADVGHIPLNPENQFLYLPNFQ